MQDPRPLHDTSSGKIVLMNHYYIYGRDSKHCTTKLIYYSINVDKHFTLIDYQCYLCGRPQQGTYCRRVVAPSRTEIDMLSHRTEALEGPMAHTLASAVLHEGTLEVAGTVSYLPFSRICKTSSDVAGRLIQVSMSRPITQ